MRKFFYLFLIISMLLFSCSSFSSFSSFDESGLPSWIRNPSVASGRIAYVAEGSGENAESARDNAIENVLLEISDDLGFDAYTRYYRQLSGSAYVEELDGSIRTSYVREYRGGRFSCYILFDISEEAFLSLESPDLVRAREKETEIRHYLDEAKASYMSSHDVDALISALEALSISLSEPLVDEAFSPDEILSVVMYYLEPIEIRVREKSGGMDATISVRRNRGLLSQMVYSVPLNARYWIRDTSGVLKEEEISINTLEEGSYDFHNTNPYALLNGVMSISLDIDQGLIASITDIAPQGFMDEFISTLSSKRVIYSYDERDDYTDLPYCIFMAEYDIDGALIEDGSSALDEFNTTLEESGRGIKALEGEGEDDEEIIKNSSSPLKEYVIVIRLGVSDIVEVDEQRFIVSVHTSMNCYNPSTMALISSETSVSSVGYGSSYEAAASDAFKRAGRILADVLMIDL